MSRTSPSYNEARAEQYGVMRAREWRVVYQAVPYAKEVLDYNYPPQSSTLETPQKQTLDKTTYSQMGAYGLDAEAISSNNTAQLSKEVSDLAADNPLGADSHEFGLSSS